MKEQELKAGLHIKYVRNGMENYLYLDIDTANNDLNHDIGNFILQAVNVWGSKFCDKVNEIEEEVES